jgi:hypothetical protein
VRRSPAIGGETAKHPCCRAGTNRGTEASSRLAPTTRRRPQLSSWDRAYAQFCFSISFPELRIPR